MVLFYGICFDLKIVRAKQTETNFFKTEKLFSQLIRNQLFNIYSSILRLIIPELNLGLE